ncbi:MAG: hypothetical protein K2X47_17160, partial [Bdellovibrionales bacterium]|nr:hypothetical protein [Bdellovibrionales bacterium]
MGFPKLLLVNAIAVTLVIAFLLMAPSLGYCQDNENDELQSMLNASKKPECDQACSDRVQSAKRDSA